MTSLSQDESYMMRCIQLARCGVMDTQPNPMVGAVIVHGGRIIGEGYHIQCGGPHAEVRAIGSVKDPALLKDSTLYVSLEPCAHWGKTPPCADLIIHSGIPRVVVGCTDPFPQVSGKGIAMLRAHGVEVLTGVLEEECRHLNRVFLTWVERHRPYVILKWAQSQDGFMDRKRSGPEQSPQRFSDSVTQVATHLRRCFCQAILVGTETARMDNPRLDCRLQGGTSPLRVVLDRNLRLKSHLDLMSGNRPTVVFCQKGTMGHRKERPEIRYEEADFSGDVLREVLDRLGTMGIRSLLVEGGRRLLEGFIQSGLWDEAQVETAPFRLQDGVPSPRLDHAGGNPKKMQISDRVFLVYHNFP